MASAASAIQTFQHPTASGVCVLDLLGTDGRVVCVFGGQQTQKVKIQTRHFRLITVLVSACLNDGKLV